MAKYTLNSYGWSMEVIAKNLTDKQVEKIEGSIKKSGYDELWEIRHELDELIDIDIWDGDVIHLTKPFDNGTMYFVLEDDTGKEVLTFDINDIVHIDVDDEKSEHPIHDAYPNETDKRNIYFSVDENKGGLFSWEFDSDEIPTVKDFKCSTGFVETPHGDWDFIDKIYFKDNELEIYDYLDNSGKSSTIEIYTHDDRVIK